MDKLITSISNNGYTFSTFIICLVTSLVLGAVIAAGYMYRSHYTKSFVATLALLPAIVQVIILMVNGNLGIGVAVAGTFSLVRFRSVPGNAREIGSVFLSMAVGLATGMGYIGIAVIFAVVMVAFSMLYTCINFGGGKKVDRELKITIPEDIDYSELFNDIFEEYTTYADLVKVRTTNMGSLFQLVYRIRMKDASNTKKMIDDIRCRNGNLDISCTVPSYGREEL